MTSSVSRANFLPSVIFVIFSCLLAQTVAYRYLGIVPFPSKSHFFIGSTLLEGLARQGHEVTVISPYSKPNPPKTYKEILTPSVIEFIEGEKENLFEQDRHGVLASIVNFHMLGLQNAKMILNEPGVKALLKSNQTFDAVICEVFLSESLYGFSDHYNVPLIGFGTFGASTWNTDMVGSPSPPSYVPHPLLKFTDHMTLWQRMGNLGFYAFERLMLNYYYLPMQEALYKQYFPHAKRTMDEVTRNTALVLLNQHVSLGFPRPYMPNMIEIGGVQINKNRKPLPADLQKFLDEAKHGAIFFSMGSNIKGKNIPVDKRNAMLETFRGLKLRVLWKFEDSDLLKDKPANLYVSSWFPQDDVLAHPNLKAFITHGGLLSTTESIYHGKPFIGLPIFGDQFLNMGRAVAQGYGIMVDFKTLSVPSFTAAIEQITTDPSYTKKVSEMSARFRDQETDSLERAVFWMEHVVRSNGAKYLHSAGQDLNFIQYHNIDVMLIFLGGLLFILLLNLFIIRCVFRSLWNRCFSKGTHAKVQAANKKKRN